LSGCSIPGLTRLRQGAARSGPRLAPASRSARIALIFGERRLDLRPHLGRRRRQSPRRDPHS